MATSVSALVAVTDTRGVLVENEAKVARPFTIQVDNGTVYIGGDAVTAANGIMVSAGGSWDGWLDPKESLYAITAAGSVNVRTLVGPGADVTGV